MDERDTTRQMEETADEARGQAWQTANQASDQARDYGRQAVHRASEMRERAAESARSLAGQAREQVTQQAQQLRERGESMIDDQKGRAADEVSHLSGAIRGAAERLREDPKSAVVAGYADTIAGQLDQAADYLRNRDLMSLLNDAQGFARRRPELVLGGMFLAGLAVARFVKAANAPSGQGSYSGESFSSGDEYGGYSGYRSSQAGGNYRGAEAEADTGFGRSESTMPIGTLGAQYGTSAGGLAGGLDHVDRGDTPDSGGIVSTSADADISGSNDINTSGTNAGGAPSVQP